MSDRDDSGAAGRIQAYLDASARYGPYRQDLIDTANAGGGVRHGLRATDLRTVLAENEAMRLVLWRRIDDEPCDIDHNGYCQAHGLSAAPCWQAEARRLVGEWQPADTPAEGGE